MTVVRDRRRRLADSNFAVACTDEISIADVALAATVFDVTTTVGLFDASRVFGAVFSSRGGV